MFQRHHIHSSGLGTSKTSIGGTAQDYGAEVSLRHLNSARFRLGYDKASSYSKGRPLPMRLTFRAHRTLYMFSHNDLNNFGNHKRNSHGPFKYTLCAASTYRTSRSGHLPRSLASVAEGLTEHVNHDTRCSMSCETLTSDRLGWANSIAVPCAAVPARTRVGLLTMCGRVRPLRFTNRAELDHGIGKPKPYAAAPPRSTGVEEHE